jgi:hypothetical protein
MSRAERTGPNGDKAHGRIGAPPLDSIRMEWILLAADDLDDLVGSIRHTLWGLRLQLGTWLVIVSSVTTLVAMSAIGVAPILICGIGLFASVAVAFALRRRAMALDPPERGRR